MLVGGLEVKSIRVFLFGSVARGTDTPESDTDIMLVIDDAADREKVLDRLSENTPEAFARFRTGFNVTLLAEGELARRIKRKDAFISAAMTGAISVEVKEKW